MRKTINQAVITSLSTVISGLLGITFYIYLARFLGPSSFGIFSVAVLVMTMVADIANVGTDTGIVRFVGKNRLTNPTKALKFLKLGLVTKLTVGISILVGGYLFVPFISEGLLQKPELIHPLRLALVGSLGVLLFTFVASGIQAFEKFKIWGILNISLNLLRLVAVFLLWKSFSLNLDNSLYVYIVFPFIGFLVGNLFLPNYFKVTNQTEVKGEFFHYNKWVALFILIAAIASRLDTYLSAKFLDLYQVGIYSAATSLAAIGPQIVAGIATVVAPKLSAFEKKKQAKHYLLRLQIFVVSLALVGIIFGIPLSGYLIPLIYGDEYVLAVNPFVVLLISQALFLISIPVHTAVLYYFSNPRLFVWISLVNLAIIGGLGWFLIQHYNFMGAAATVLIGNMSNFVIPGVWVVREFNKK